MNANRQLGAKFTVTQDFHLVGLLGITLIIQKAEVDLRHTEFVGDMLQLPQIKHNKFNPLRVFETYFGQAHLEGHLAAFEIALVLMTRTRLIAFVAAGGSASMTGALTAGDPLAFLDSTFCRP